MQGLGRLKTILPWYPFAPNLACTNEAAPRGESPDGHTAEIPDGHTAESPHGHTAETPDSHPGVADEGPYKSTVVEMCCVEGLTTYIPGELVVARPRVPNRDRGTQRGDYEYNIRSPVCFRTSGRHNVTEHSTDNMFPEHSTDMMFPGFLCLPRILIEKSPESFRSEIRQ